MITRLINRFKLHWRHFCWVYSRKLHEWVSLLFRNSFFTFHLRPKFSRHVLTRSAGLIPAGKLAIVIRGPIVQANRFTLETIELYKKTFPGAHIIVSTWASEDPDLLKEAELLGAEVIANQKPNKNDEFNTNFQLVHAYNGIKRASDLGYEYCFKTRSDQRFYRQDIFDFFVALLKQFPLESVTGQRQRLLIPSFGTAKYRLYSIADVMMFGDTRDMLSYWNADFYEVGIKPYVSVTDNQVPPVICGMPIVAEIYLGLKYMERLARRPLWTLQDSWAYIRDHFCVVDGASLDWYWDKHLKLHEHRYLREYDNTNPRNIDFADWLQLHVERAGKWEGIRPMEKWQYEGSELKVVNL